MFPTTAPAYTSSFSWTTILLYCVALLGLVFVGYAIYTSLPVPSQEEPSLPPPPVPEVLPTAQERESWCFVGEDLSGRYCVRVPSEKSCDPDRTFLDRSACEMTAASHMPAGIVSKGGVGLLPLY